MGFFDENYQSADDIKSKQASKRRTKDQLAGFRGDDVKLAQGVMGLEPKPEMGPPAPPNAWEDGSRYSDGRLKDPMVNDDHGMLPTHLNKNPEALAVLQSQPAGFQKFKAAIGANTAMKGKVPPKSKLPKGAPPQKPEEVIAASAAAHTPDDEDGLKQLKDMIDKFEKGENKMDLSPLMALTDSWTGSQLVQGYKRPMGDEEREQIVMGLRTKLFQEEADIKTKAAYNASQERMEALRQKFKQEDAEADRKNRLQVANIGAAGNAGKAADKEEAKHQAAKSRYLKEEKASLAGIAKMRRPPKDSFDKSYEMHMGALNDEIYDLGQEAERLGLAPKGKGYRMILEEYKAEKPAGPDSGTKVSDG